MEVSEKRKFKRLGAKFGVSCIVINSIKGQFQTGSTINVSTGGLYFETSSDTFKQGSLLKIHLTIPPKTGILEFGGTISGFAKVLRTEPLGDLNRRDYTISGKQGVALEFCRSPKFCI
jgi:hypothetical protein